MSRNKNEIRVGIDIGGTFTDFVLFDESKQELVLHKSLTTPVDPSYGAMIGIKELLKKAKMQLSEVTQVVHGTTLAINAIIERKGANLGFLATKGFLDVLEMGTEQRYDIHDLFLSYPEPLAPRSQRKEIDERIDRDGNVVTPINLDDLQKEIEILLTHNIDALAICFMHSYANPVHEKMAKEFITKNFPDLKVSISSEIHPQIREYERSSTVASNAYVQPLMSTYVAKFQEELSLRGFLGDFHLIQSSGGLTAPKTASEIPIRFLESGPAGGVQSTAAVGEKINRSDILSFDMGGTTAKAALVENGKPKISPMLEVARTNRFKKGSGLPVFVPVIDMIEIGAGGGSIARVDPLGLLKVGPESAGAEPGPACYGKGGKLPTVTDANLVLGYLDSGYFLGGTMSLDKAAALDAIADLSKSLGLSTLATASGIYDLVCENMAAAARVHIVETGRDPRGYAMVAMGGAGPLHAAAVAEKLGIKEIIIPAASGTASALGFLGSPISFSVTKSKPIEFNNFDAAVIEVFLKQLEEESSIKLSEAGHTGSVNILRQADLRLVGQMHELTIDLPSGRLTTASIEKIKVAFFEEYERRYTHVKEGAEIEILNWHLTCYGQTPNSSGKLNPKENASPAMKGMREAWVAAHQEFMEVPVYDRYSLNVGTEISGPLIVEENEATTIVPANFELTVDQNLNLLLKRDGLTSVQKTTFQNLTYEEQIKAITADPVGLEIMWSRLINIAEECWYAVIRTAFSLIIGEAQDFACEILDPAGRQIVHSPRAMPVFNLTLPIAVNAMLKRFPLDSIKEGDVLITNDPWLCAGHLFDIAIAVPVIVEKKVVAFVGVVGHVSDIGGTKDSLNAREIFDEGFQIPPMKLYRAGVPNRDLLELLEANVRLPDQVLGDLNALVAAAMTGRERIKSFIEEYGLEDLKALTTVVQDKSEAAMRKSIRETPDGIYENVIQGDGLTDALSFPVQVKIEGDSISVRFDGSPPQLSRGGSNCTLTYTKAHATYPLKCIFSPEIPGNAGCYKPITVDAPAGSMLNCDRPASVNIRTRTGWYIGPNIYLALADATPHRVQAFTGLPSSAQFYGVEENGRLYSDHLFQGGGQGASAGSDGKSALLYPTSAANTSVEMFEARVPALVLRKELIVDSGGAGNFRGGLGQVISTRKLKEDGNSCQIGIFPMGIHSEVEGLFGGQSGGYSRGIIHRAKDIEYDVGTGGLAELTEMNEVAELYIAGGSGYGDPLARPFETVQRDIDEGYISQKCATEIYGCVVKKDRVIDIEASDVLRKAMRDGTT